MRLATLCYVQDGQSTLMLQRNKKDNDIHQGKWNGLGGKFEQGETPEECVVREVEEESGLLIVNPQLAGFLSFPRFKDREDWYVFVFTASDYSGELICSSEGTLAWVPTEELLQLELWEGDHYFLPWVAEQRFFSARFVYENKRLIKHEVIFYPAASNLKLDE